MDLFDVIVIGGGPAGYLAAERAGEAGLATLLVEKREVGGVCLNEGCIPTKTLLNAAKIFDVAGNKGAQYGVQCGNMGFDHATVIKKKDEVVGTLVGGVKIALKKKKVKVVYADASLSRRDGSFEVLSGSEVYTGKNVLIATGSAPAFPPLKGLAGGMQDGSILTSREMLDLKSVPKNLAVIGGGVIGLEMAAYYSAVGSRVAVIEMLDKIGGELDAEAAEVLQGNLERSGVVFRLGCRVKDVSDRTVAFEKDGKEQQLSYDKLLISAGRKPVVDMEGLKETGVLIQNGAIVTDESMRTNIPDMYAAGDVNGKFLLAHVAYREAEVAVNNMAGASDRMDYSAVPGVIYTQPEVAFAGISLKEAAAQGMDAAEKKASVNMSGRHIAENGLSNGFIKLVVDRKKGVLLGAIMVSAYASEIIYSLSLIIQNKIPLDAVKKTMFPHPTVCEVIKEALFS
jgi:dihydrolipoamide dehydrogenase